ncbi:MAG: N-acetyl-gamma-glutamyl-phosphate reductase [Oscillospiraceae bacterium]|nr:N-acetyl-gamma-glutamyl-phosphate reductase [Oscillospiraceae bacterium]
MTKVFIDGSAGTTGLRISDRLAQRKDLKLIRLPEELRKDAAARAEAINGADIVFLCLPDAAAIEAVALVESDRVRIIDTSTAHRTNGEWTYGFPELAGLRQKIAGAKRIANPGCHASGFIALAAPLVQERIIPVDLQVSCFSLTGYSGGGKKMIAEYESADRNSLLKGPRQYALTQQHKHLKEMAKLSGIVNLPVFCPIVADFYSGMEVTIPLFADRINGTAEQIRQIYRDYYSVGLVHYSDEPDQDGFLSAAAYSGRDDLQVSVHGNEERILLTARFDNLGKGASGAAIQNMNILLGLDEATGLNIEK